MATLNTYLNFDGTAEAAFKFYKSIFGGEFETLQYIKDMPGGENFPENEKSVSPIFPYQSEKIAF